MTVLSIRMIGDPVLRTPAARVASVDSSLRELIGDMHQTMDAVEGIGLAAPQIGVSLRVFTYAVDDQRGAVINPELDLPGPSGFTPRVPEAGPAEGENLLREGCLSVAGIHGPVSRSQRAVLTGLSPEGRRVQFEVSGLLAACFQHEVDHLDGRLFVDRLTGEDRVAAARALRARDYDHAVSQTQDSRRTAGAGSSFFAS